MVSEYCPSMCEWVGAWLHDNNHEIPHHSKCPHCNNVTARLVPFSESGPLEDSEAADICEAVMDDGCGEIIITPYEDFFSSAPSDLLDIIALHVDKWALVCKHCGRAIRGNSPEDAITRWNELRQIMEGLDGEGYWL